MLERVRNRPILGQATPGHCGVSGAYAVEVVEKERKLELGNLFLNLRKRNFNSNYDHF